MSANKAYERACRLGLELGAVLPHVEGNPDRIWETPYETEVQHSVAISLLRIATYLEVIATNVPRQNGSKFEPTQKQPGDLVVTGSGIDVHP